VPPARIKARENCYWTVFKVLGNSNVTITGKKNIVLFYIPGPDEQNRLVFSKLEQKSLQLKRKRYFLFRKRS